MQHGKLALDDLKVAAEQPIDWLLEDYIPKNSLGILVGEWGIGKSPFALQMQLSLASNVPFLKRFNTTKKARCLYIDMENSAQAVGNIIQTQSKYIGAEAPNIEVYSPNYVKHVAGNENVPEFKYILWLIKNDPVDFVIIDPLRMFQPQAEAKNTEAAQMIKQMRDIATEAGSSIMFIHHPRKISGDPTIERFHLDSNPTEWMSNACGAASLVQNMDFRIGLEDGEEYIMCRRFVRNRGWYPVDYIDRDFDEDTLEPRGYFLKIGIEQLNKLELQLLNDLPKEFSTHDFLLKSKKSRTRATLTLKRWESVGVIKGVKRGFWLKNQ